VDRAVATAGRALGNLGLSSVVRLFASSPTPQMRIPPSFTIAATSMAGSRFWPGSFSLAGDDMDSTMPIGRPAAVTISVSVCGTNKAISRG
jgi:hypothetical protein